MLYTNPEVVSPLECCIFIPPLHLFFSTSGVTAGVPSINNKFQSTTSHQDTLDGYLAPACATPGAAHTI